MAEKQTIYSGESRCEGIHKSGKHEGSRCVKRTYYSQKGKYLCGMHSSVDSRKKLPKNPNAGDLKVKRLTDQKESVDTAREKNKSEGREGSVRCSKIGMMKSPEDFPGFLKVFPNNKHQNRKDGFGCASLSPMALGPVEHRQKGLPPCKLLENYHQFNKVYDCEVNKDKTLKREFYESQIRAYKSNQGKRRKFTGKMSINGICRRPRTLYSLHWDPHGAENKYNYVQSRYLYCHFYEKLIRGNKDLAKLREMLKEGTNLQIVGYDGYDVHKDLMYHYTDISRPFGHELVLYTILTTTDPEQYPWNKYYEMHGKELYPQHLKPAYLKSKDMEKLKGTDEKAPKSDQNQATTSKAPKSDRNQHDQATTSQVTNSVLVTQDITKSKEITTEKSSDKHVQKHETNTKRVAHNVDSMEIDENSETEMEECIIEEYETD